MKKILTITALLLVAAGFAYTVYAESTASLLAQNRDTRFGIQTLTSGVDNAIPVTMTGTPNRTRIITRIGQLPVGANNTSVLTVKNAAGKTFKFYSLPQVTDGQAQFVDLVTGQVFANGALSAATVSNRPSYIPIALAPNDTFQINGSTNAVTTYRIEYVDIYN